jgi:ATP synthase protein I
MDPNRDGREPPSETARSIGALSTVGLSFVLAIVLGAWFGYLLDKWFGTSPLFFLIFFVLGFAGGALNVYRTANKFIK